MLAGMNQPRGRSWVPSLLQDSGWQTGRAWVTWGLPGYKSAAGPRVGPGRGLMLTDAQSRARRAGRFRFPPAV